MSKTLSLFPLLLACFALSRVATAVEPQSFSYADLVRRELDLERMAILPAKGETLSRADEDASQPRTSVRAPLAHRR